MPATLKQVEALFNELDVEDQIKLMQSLAPRVIAAKSAGSSHAERSEAAWQEYRRIAMLVAQLPSGPETSAELVSNMRR